MAPQIGAFLVQRLGVRRAAAERWDKTRAAGGQGIDGVKRFGSEARGQASSVKGRLAARIAERKLRRSEGDE